MPDAAAHWTHDLSPFLVQFGNGYGIRWYGLAYLAGFMIAWRLFLRWSREGWLPLDAGAAGDLLTAAIIGTLLGGRLGYCLLYDLPMTLRDPASVIAFWRHGGLSGMASHGGVLGMVAGAWWFARQRKVSPWRFWDAIALAAPPGIFLGRIANFINGELWGRPSNAPWAVIFPDSPAPLVPRHPSQLYEALLEGLLLGAVLWTIQRRTPREGAVFAGVLTAYPLLRILGECFREPDIQIGYMAFGLTQGQILSLAMLAPGAACWAWVLRRPAGMGKAPPRG